MASLGDFLDAKLFTIGESPVTTTTLITGITVVLATYLMSKLIQAGIQRGLNARGLRTDGSVGVATRLLHYLLPSRYRPRGSS